MASCDTTFSGARRTSPICLDIPSKVHGTAKYAIDFSTPGMLYAALAMAPVQGGTLLSVDTTPAESMPACNPSIESKYSSAIRW